jgi:hypothetical protein
VLILINNAGLSRNVTVNVGGVQLQGLISGEQSTRSVYWGLLPPFFPTDSSTFDVSLPALSVTTLTSQIPSTPASERRRSR